MSSHEHSVETLLLQQQRIWQGLSDIRFIEERVGAIGVSGAIQKLVLAQDPTVQTLQSDLLGALDYTATTGTGTSAVVTSLASMGITVGPDGTLSVNSTTLNSALQNNFGQVQNFFQGSALNGFANSLDQQLTSFISPADGAFTVDLHSMSSENTTLEDDVTNFQANVIAPLKTQLTSEFSAAEIALQQLPGQIKDVDAELGINTSSSS